MDIKNLTLSQKIAQMFITGFRGADYNRNDYFKMLLKNNLGGVIFFSDNILDAGQFKSLIEKLKSQAGIPLFLSIDQEGGRVERTENIYHGKKYLSAKYAYQNGPDFLKRQTENIADELKTYGINMNFAPVLDVNTNKNNPIIGERAFSDKTCEVIEASEIVLNAYKSKNIITVGKHFPGHGASNADSHKTLPVIDIPRQELEQIHIAPFKYAVEKGIPSIMTAHVLYPALECGNIPSSISKTIITGLLINKLKFNGIIMTDDMEMNGIKGYSSLEACISGINAGITMFIFRSSTADIVKLINDIENSVKKGIIDEEKINNAVEKIYKIKCLYGIAR